MGHLDIRLALLLIGSICSSQIFCFTLSKGVEVDDTKKMAPNMLELTKATEIRFACPRSDSFCIPRVKCPVKSVVYDRESLRFMEGDKKFKDEFGCGAFSPTWTYVCCVHLDKLEDGNWKPNPDLWFYPSMDGSAPATDVDPSAPFPILLPWPGFKNVSSSTAGNSKSDEKSTTEIPKKQQEENSTEKPKEKLSERSVAQEPPRSPPPPVMPPFPDPRMNNPMFNPNAPMPFFNPQFMFPPPQPGMDPLFHLQSGMPDPRLAQRFGVPRPDWIEAIFIFPDGTIHRSFQDPRAMGMGIPPMQPVTDRPNPVSMEPPRRPTLDFPQQSQSAQTIVADSETGPLRTRRAIDAKFKVPPAAGGMWQGDRNKTAESEGRALLPPPKAVWGSPGSGNVPVVPIPQAFGVDAERCGVSSSTGINARILSGRKPGSELQAETSFAEFPWHVAIVNGETGDYLCAGTIISARFVLTVAHCVRKFSFTLLFVRVGDWDLSGVGEMFPSYDVEVGKVIVHEEFYAGNLQNDIALLQLKFPLDFTIMPHVGTICLPPSSEPIYSDCIVTGWGQQLSTAEAKGDVSTFSRTLKQTSQTLVTAPSCEKSLRPFLGQFYQLPKKGFVCAFDKDGKDSCFGDGGGALACRVNAPNYPKPNQYHVVGLVSWGVGCGMPNVPSAYTAVWDYLDWIRERVAPIDPYPMANPQPLKDPSPMIMVRSNEASTTTKAPTTTKPDFIDLAFS